MTAVDVPLPTMPASNPELDALCHCGSRRRDHAGRKRLGHCVAHVEVGGAVQHACPGGCRRYWPARGERLRLRALAVIDEPLLVPIAEADKARPRSRKTELARAEDQFGVGPSDAGTCRKRIEYRERPPEGFEPVEVDRAAAYEGTLLHEGITKARKRRYPWRKYDLQVQVPGLDRPGELDEYDPITGVVVDNKTAGEAKWDRVGTYGAPESEWEQLLMYGLALENDGQPVTRLELHYYRRENFRDNERFIRDYDRAAALRAVAKLHVILDDLTEGRELPRDESGPTTSVICRYYCEAVGDCWNVTEAELNRRTPEGWLLARDRPEIEEALGRYLAAHETLYKPGDQTKDQERALVYGAETGRYGPYTLTYPGGNTSWVNDPKARLEQLEGEMADAADRGRPPAHPDQLPMPQRQHTTPTQTRIGRVRKADLEREAREAAKAAVADA